jgi:tetratricopeptide (TPR) repeat protein
MRRVLLSLFLLSVLSPSLRSQESIRRQLNDVIVLEKQGHFEQAIRSVHALIDTNDLGDEAGRAWTILGFACEQLGRYQQARKAYEQALQILQKSAPHSIEYGSALLNFANLNNVTQGPDVAARMWKKALKVHTEMGFHAGMAQDYALLAGAALAKKHIAAGKKELEKAIEEGKLVQNPTAEQAILLSDIQGWKANVEGDGASELAAYQRSLELWQQNHGEESPMAAWAYLYLGVAYADCKERERALASVHKGLQILDRVVGHNTPPYLTGEMLLAKVLDQEGMRDEALQVRKQAQWSAKELFHGECADCTVSVASLR